MNSVRFVIEALRKLTAFHYLSICAVCFALLAMPAPWAERLGVTIIRREPCWILGPVAVSALVLLLCQVGLRVGRQLQSWHIQRVAKAKRETQIAGKLESLSPEEWEPLLWCVDRRQRSFTGHTMDP